MQIQLAKLSLVGGLYMKHLWIIYGLWLIYGLYIIKFIIVFTLLRRKNYRLQMFVRGVVRWKTEQLWLVVEPTPL